MGGALIAGAVVVLIALIICGTVLIWKMIDDRVGPWGRE